MICASTIFGLPGLEAPSAWAKDGADDGGGHHGGTESGDDKGSGERSGSGNGGGQDDGRSGSSGSDSGSGCGASGSFDLVYSDGFEEHVADCTYTLTDRQGRVVITRAATARDIDRLSDR